MKRPFHKVNIEISNICNLQCSFCPEVIREKKMMSVQLFEHIIQQVAPNTDQVCLHLMGDPLVHPKVFDFFEICRKHQVKIFFVTNGVLLKESNIEVLLHPQLRQVNFSLHSFFDNFPNKDPQKYLEKIFYFTDLAFQKRPDLYINYRLWNLQDPKGASSQNTEMLQKIEEHFQISLQTQIDVRQRKSILIKDRLYLHFDTEFIWPSLELPVLGESGTCYGLTSHFGILVDGTVVPCCLDKEGVISLGNIQNQSLLEILESPRAKQMLLGFRQRTLIEDLCRRCNYIDRFKRSDSKAVALQS